MTIKEIADKLDAVSFSGSFSYDIAEMVVGEIKEKVLQEMEYLKLPRENVDELVKEITQRVIARLTE